VVQAEGRTGFVRQEGPDALCTHVGTPSDPADPGALLCPDQIARICGLARRAVYRSIARGDLAAARLCNRLRVRPEDLDRWISESVEPRSVAQPDILVRSTPPAVACGS
jgi:excisionase family DNA binding protein